MIHRDIMSPQKAIKAILVLSLVVLVGIVFTLHILPKGIAWGSACVGIKLDSSDLGTKYGMGIAGLSQILCKHRNAVQIEQNLFKAEVAQAAAALFSK